MRETIGRPRSVPPGALIARARAHCSRRHARRLTHTRILVAADSTLSPKFLQRPYRHQRRPSLLLPPARELPIRLRASSAREEDSSVGRSVSECKLFPMQQRAFYDTQSAALRKRREGTGVFAGEIFSFESSSNLNPLHWVHFIHI